MLTVSGGVIRTASRWNGRRASRRRPWRAATAAWPGATPGRPYPRRNGRRGRRRPRRPVGPPPETLPPPTRAAADAPDAAAAGCRRPAASSCGQRPPPPAGRGGVVGLALDAINSGCPSRPGPGADPPSRRLPAPTPEDAAPMPAAERMERIRDGIWSIFFAPAPAADER